MASARLRANGAALSSSHPPKRSPRRQAQRLIASINTGTSTRYGTISAMRSALSVSASATERPAPTSAAAHTRRLSKRERCASDTMVALSNSTDTSIQVASTASDRSVQTGESGHRCRPPTPVMATWVRPISAEHAA